MGADTLAIADRLERSGAAAPLARAIAAELAEEHAARRRELDNIRSELVTREYLDLALGKLRAEVERDIAGLRADTQRDVPGLRVDMERMMREQTSKLVTWMAAIIGLAVTTVSGLGVLF